MTERLNKEGKAAMDYYFDSRNGKNSNAGTSPEQAWRDFRRIHDSALAPGDRLLLRRGSHFKGQLRVRAVGTEAAWIEITAYGEGPRPVVEGHSEGGSWEINHTGSFDESTPCIYVTEAAYLRVSHLTVYRSYYGLLINNFDKSHSHIVVEDVLAVDIQNFGQHDPRVNSAGIEIAVGRGHDCTDVVVGDVEIRDCECFRTGCGFSLRSYGQGCRLERVRASRITDHDHADTPWSYTGLHMKVCDAVIDGLCLDKVAPHWKPSGTAGVHCASDRLTVRNSYVARMDDAACHDKGAWDFEGGSDCVLENCTFENNAGPGIEFLGALRNGDVRDCTFIHNNWARWSWGLPGVFFVGDRGRAGGSGVVHDCRFVLAPGTRLEPCEPFALRNNTVYARVEDLPPCVRPPAVDAGGDRVVTELNVPLAGRVSNATAFRWEAVIAPGKVRFEDENRLETRVRFSRRGVYVLRLVAENEHFLYGDYITVRCLKDERDDLSGRWTFERDGREATGRGHNAELAGKARCAAGALRLDGRSGGAKIEGIELGRTFSLACWIRLAGNAAGARTILANAGGGIASNGFKLFVNRRGERDGALYLESGNGVDGDLAYSAGGLVTPGEWHHVAATLDCTSRDGWGAARLYLDGRDVTLWNGLRSDVGRGGPLLVGKAPRSSVTIPEALLPTISPDLPEFPVPEGFELVFADDFQDGLADNWTAVSGQWRTGPAGLEARGKSEIRCRRRFPGDMLLVYEAESDQPGDLSAFLNAFDGREDNPSADFTSEGRRLRHVDSSQGYFFGFGSGGNAYSQFNRHTAVLARYEGRITPGRIHRVACLRLGNRLSHWADGKALFEYEDPRPVSAGRQPYVTLYAHTTGRFRNVRVYAPARRDSRSPLPWAGELRDLILWPRVLGAPEISRFCDCVSSGSRDRVRRCNGRGWVAQPPPARAGKQKTTES